MRTSATSKVMVLTGGPGTGKTTILNAIIQVFAENKAKILLAAPTGRAAKRMSEAIGREARTIHRLLEYTPKDDGFARNEDNPLACGLLVVDGVHDGHHAGLSPAQGGSARRDHRVRGRRASLPSVGPGNVLGDPSLPGHARGRAGGGVPAGGESEIVCNAHLINRGELPRLESSRIVFPISISCGRTIPIARRDIIVDLVKNHIPAVSSLSFLDEIQVLSAHAQGHRGRGEPQPAASAGAQLEGGGPCSAESGSTGSATGHADPQQL